MSYNEDSDERTIKRTPSVSKELSKKFINPDTNEELYYINIDHGLKRGLHSVMDFRNKLAAWPDMCRINIKIKRT